MAEYGGRFLLGVVLAAGARLVLAGSVLWAAADGVATFTVNSTLDAHDAAINGVCETANGNGVCTLRAAIEEANFDPGLPPTISVPPGFYLVMLGGLSIGSGMTIAGAGRGLSQIAAGPGTVHILFHNNEGLVLEDLTFSGATEGAVSSIANLVVRRCSFENNESNNSVEYPFGGSISYEGGVGESLLVEESMFSSGVAQVGGHLMVCGDATIRDSVFDAGSASSSGGAISIGNPAIGCAGSAVIDRTLITGSTSQRGGGIFVYGASWILMSNSTLGLNRAMASGGGIFVESGGSAAIYNSTIAWNDADDDLDLVGTGGGIFVHASGTASLANSILAGNRGTVEIINPIPHILRWPQDCSGYFAGNFDIVGDNSQGFCTAPAGNYIVANPQLGPLQYNGGFSRTYAIPPGSVAWNGGNPSGCTSGANWNTVDQRGAVRPFAGVCDIGAFEYGPLIFADDFELGSPLRWSAASP